ncbi:hypothetical protein BC826DRAFT_1044062 [Russula brevipes]|nr:hypothetical protein BC826DRAFT_1044062 [Russula brevipes]
MPERVNGTTPLKDASVVLYSLRGSLSYIKDIPLRGGAFLACHIGLCLRIADREQYSLVYLDAATATPILPRAPQEPGTRPHRPMILVVAEDEFLTPSWMGAGTMGVFINVNGDPVRGTLQWPNHPRSIGSLSPLTPGVSYVMALLPDQIIQVHNIESQEIAQEVLAPLLPSPNEQRPDPSWLSTRRALAMSCNGFLVPSQRQAEMLMLKKVSLLGRNGKPGGREVVAMSPVGGEGQESNPP